MTIEVLLFAAAREACGTDRVFVELAPDSTVGSLRDRLARDQPPLRPILPLSRIAVENVFAPDERTIAPGLEIAVIPPVAGG